MTDSQNIIPATVKRRDISPESFSLIRKIPLDRAMIIAVIGDVHDQWDEEDEIALKHLGVDLVLLVGDFGNEAVKVVREIAAMDLPKAAIFGNHDAWYSASESGKKKCPYDRSHEDRVQQQIDLLGDTHVGYGKLDFPQFGLTVVGSRPFSWGGAEWKNAEFYRTRYGVTNFEESTAKIVSAASRATFDTVICLGHSGPRGLGPLPESPCGKDWHPLGGDLGDPDFEAAIAQIRQSGKTIPLVAFGHMHHSLRHTQEHQRIPLIASPDNTIYLNAACVPRIKQKGRTRLRNFSLVSLHSGMVSQVSLVWVNHTFDVVSEQILYNSCPIRHPDLNSLSRLF
jgi:uncharacterized protein (TIGR04168 family)